MPKLNRPKLIINLRGTHGSGKSTIVKHLIELYNGVTTTASLNPESRKPKPEGHQMETPYGLLTAVGPYHTACGGCDGIQPYARIWPLVEKYAALGHVIFEGALVSSSYGEIGRSSEKFGRQFVFAILDTPVDVCLARIVARRKERGVDKPFNEDNTKNKFKNILRSLETMQANGRRVVHLNYLDPIPQILELFQKG